MDHDAPRALPGKVGRYEIVRLLGHGGMATVYLARDLELNRPVALKVPHARLLGGAHILDRFRREAQAAAALDHPNICPVYEVGRAGNVHYLAMAYIDGRPLSKLVRPDQPLPPRRAAALVRKVALAMHEAHARGVLHRDLKPANVMINKRNEPVIMDFGLARLMKQEDVRLTQSGILIGTPAYMAPEQATGFADGIGPGCDIYSLGVMLFELLTGRLPFTGPAVAVLGQVLVTEPPRPSQFRPGLDPALEAICLKAMAKKPEDRHPSMEAFAAALAGYLRRPGAGTDGQALVPTTSGPTDHGEKQETPPAPARPTPSQAFHSRRWARLPLLAAGAAVLLAVVLGGWMLFRRSPSPDQRDSGGSALVPRAPGGDPRDGGGQGKPPEDPEFVRQQAKLAALLRDLEGLVAHPPPDAVREAKGKVAELAREQPGIDRDERVLDKLKALYQALYERVRYVGALPDLRPPPPEKEDAAPGLLVAQLLGGVPPVGGENNPVVLALVRGVLYGLSQRSGEVLWAMRVGIDTTTLPLRVPPSATRPEMVLALSAEPAAFTAVNAATGEALWRYALGAPCLGSPVVVGPRAYVPTYDGKVHEIELAEGRPLGYYQLGQRLTLGGAHQEGSDFIYVPAEDQCVYVLNVKDKEHPCQAVLYSGHPSGSLRAEPLVVSRRGRPRHPGDRPGPQDELLVLGQADGLNATSLRAFALPAQNGDDGPPAVQTAPTPGWAWLSPSCDGENVVLATDAGAVALFGINQKGDEDTALFPLIRNVLSLPGVPGAAEGPSARAEVVSWQGDSLWVLARGGMQKFSLAWGYRDGRRFVADPLWKEPLALGSPLHRSQTDVSGSTLLTVTQSLEKRVCLATAVNAATKEILWQRQIGMVCQGAPVPLGQEVFALDQGGGVFAFRPQSFEGHDQWQAGGQGLAKPLDDDPDVPPSLHPGGDGKSLYEVAFPGKGTQLVVRRFRVDDQGRRVRMAAGDEKVVGLNAPPAGNVAVRGDSLLVPLRDGTLFRLKLPPDASRGVTGPNWRARDLGGALASRTRGYLGFLDDDTFLMTDGDTRLSRIAWPAGQAAWRLEGSVELPSGITAPPALLPRARPEEPIQVIVADAGGQLSLLVGEQMTSVRRWQLGGRVTAGPFLPGRVVGCVVDGCRLVWVDPAKDGLLWEYGGGVRIVGEPQLIEGLLAVADESGRFVGLDPGTGKVLGQYVLKSSVAPAAPPVAFGAGRAFAPLTDGTVLLLSLQKLHGPQ